jgi:hypothetical protein
VQLLTTPLQNQPLDTNQLNRRIVELAPVEQRVDMNINMQTLMSVQQTTSPGTARATTARPGPTESERYRSTRPERFPHRCGALSAAST